MSQVEIKTQPSFNCHHDISVAVSSDTHPDKKGSILTNQQMINKSGKYSLHGEVLRSLKT